MSESQLLWLVADKAEQCAAQETGLAVLLRRLGAVSAGRGEDHRGKIAKVAESAERTAASLRSFVTSTRIRAVALEAQARQQAEINATAQRIANDDSPPKGRLIVPQRQQTGPLHSLTDRYYQVIDGDEMESDG